jgi:hypothetical protein
MTREEVESLQSGDIVFWRDPDDGICSRVLTIGVIITCDHDDRAEINDSEGNYFSVPFSELEEWGGTNV